MATQEMYDKLNQIINESKKTVFFGGAGVSTESGIPDFRSKDGLYNVRDVQFEQYEPEYLLSIDCLERDTDVFFEFYRQKLETSGIQPNRAHYKLAELEKAGKLAGIITQNIDGLHQRAGSVNVAEIHGTTLKNYCMRCGKRFPADYIFKSPTPIPHCDKCGDIVRPYVTLYGEMLPDEELAKADSYMRGAEVLIVGGTSLTVWPAAGYVSRFRGSHLIIINRDATDYDYRADLVFHESIGEVLSHVSIGDGSGC